MLSQAILANNCLQNEGKGRKTLAIFVLRIKFHCGKFLEVKMNKIKLLPLLGIAFLAACTNDPTGGEKIDDDPRWKLHFPISVNESTNSFTANISYDYGVCRILESSNSTKWENKTFKETVDMEYVVNGDKLVMWPKGDENKGSQSPTYTRVVDTNDTTAFDNTSIFGYWNCDNDDFTIKITPHVFYTTEQVGPIDPTTITPVESEIDLANSYFIHDLYTCIARDYSCNFNHWHFTKSAPGNLNTLMGIHGITVNEATDRFVSLTYLDTEINVGVEHVQLDSLNSGNAYMSAYIQAQGDTCRFEHASTRPTEEVCTDDNMKYLTIFTYMDEFKTYSSKYIKDISSEFDYCVNIMLLKIIAASTQSIRD